METTCYKGFTPSDYADELYRDAKVNCSKETKVAKET